MTKNKNCMVAQSGGPTVAINSSLAGVINGVINSNIFNIVYGSVFGISGVLDNNIINLSELVSNETISLETLKTSPAMYLGSCRYKLSDSPEEYNKLFELFNSLNIGAFFYIGGNDSMDTILKLSKYAKSIGSDILFIGIPKTIDNDLCLTDHTPGFGSAAKYVATSILEIAHDSYIYNLKNVVIVEVMGRDAGWLTASCALAKNSYSKAPQLIYLPERAFDVDDFISHIEKEMKESQTVIIAVSEGIKDKNGKYLSATTATADTFGHSQLSGTGKCLEGIVKERLGVKVRSVELNVLQRCAGHISSKTDLDEAFNLGELAVKGAEAGETGCMVTMNRTSDTPYTIVYGFAPIELIANQAKAIPDNWINSEGNGVTDELIQYLSPLIQGETNTKYVNGLPNYLPVSHLIK